MAEETLLKEQLSDSMIATGEKLVGRLDEKSVPITSAFWLFSSEDNKWRLFLASPQVDSLGPRKMFEQVRDALDSLEGDGHRVELWDIGLLQPDRGIPRLFGSVMATPPTGVARIRFSKSVIDGNFIEDALIYRAA